jgi:hypothetical protein
VVGQPHDVGRLVADGRQGWRTVAGRRATAAWRAAVAAKAFQTLWRTTVRSVRQHCWARGERIRALVRNPYVPRLGRHIRRLTDEYTDTYIRWLIDKYTGPTFVGDRYLPQFWYQGI